MIASRVGVFGGSFNPPHMGHLAVAEAARDRLNLDSVLWVPNNTPPHKRLAPGASTEDRAAMTSLAIEGNSSFELSRIELDREGPSYMVDTLRQLRSESHETAFWLIIGMDSLDTFHTWREPREIVEMARLAVYPRFGFSSDIVENALDIEVDLIEAPRVEISSTELRGRLQNGQSVRYLVPDNVIRYIADNDLYR